MAVDPDSAEALGRLELLPLMDLTRLLPITLMTLIVSDEFESPTVASFPCDPSMILGMIWMRSSELSRLAAVTAAVAASTTEVIWELVRELESVLLVLRDDTLACLELLEEDRLALSSPITLEARVVVVVSSSLLFLAHEMMVRLKRNRERMMSICLTRFPISGLGELHI